MSGALDALVGLLAAHGGGGGGGGGAPPLTVTRTGSASVRFATPGLKTTSTVTVTPSGGTPPYFYAWSYLSGDTPPVPTSPMGPITAWRAYAANPSVQYLSRWQCRVTDSLGQAAVAVAIVAFTGLAT